MARSRSRRSRAATRSYEAGVCRPLLLVPSASGPRTAPPAGMAAKAACCRPTACPWDPQGAATGPADPDPSKPGARRLQPAFPPTRRGVALCAVAAPRASAKPANAPSIQTVSRRSVSGGCRVVRSGNRKLSRLPRPRANRAASACRRSRRSRLPAIAAAPPSDPTAPRARDAEARSRPGANRLPPR